jgi:hypothetical protein
MGPVNWVAVIAAALLAVVAGAVWHGLLCRTGGGSGRAGKGHATAVIAMLPGAVMLGHNYARIGAATLHAKPWLYFMQSGGIAAFFIIPALWLASARQRQGLRFRLIDAGYWLAAYLTMGAVFRVLG